MIFWALTMYDRLVLNIRILFLLLQRPCTSLEFLCESVCDLFRVNREELRELGNKIQQRRNSVRDLGNAENRVGNAGKTEGDNTQ